MKQKSKVKIELKLKTLKDVLGSDKLNKLSQQAMKQAYAKGMEDVCKGLLIKGPIDPICSSHAEAMAFSKTYQGKLKPISMHTNFIRRPLLWSPPFDGYPEPPLGFIDAEEFE